MIVAGCDIGSLTAKAILLENDEIISSAVIRTKSRPAASAREVIQTALMRAGSKLEDIACLVGTGYGRNQIPAVDRVESEISCHAKGAHHLMPTVRMVIDIGGQDAKAMRIEEGGAVAQYRYNDKCASGTGRFLEIMAEALEIPLAEMGAIADQATEKLVITSQCVIFAETEVISLVNAGKQTADILNALHRAMAKRVAALARSIGVAQDVVMTGGVAKNKGIYTALGKALNLKIKSLNGNDPQLIGALGAALCAREHADNG